MFADSENVNKTMNNLNNVRIIVGRSCEELGLSIVKHFGENSLVKVQLEDFPNGEINVKIEENIRNFDIVIVQTGVSDHESTEDAKESEKSGKKNKKRIHSLNDYIMETVLIADACYLAACKSITVIWPYFPYSRADKKYNSRTAIGAKSMTNMMRAAHVTKLVSVDLHAGQEVAFFDHPFHNLYARPIFCTYLQNNVIKNNKKDFVLLSADLGSVKRTDAYAMCLGLPTAIIHKERDENDKIVSVKLISSLKDSEVQHKEFFFIDDMVDTAGTLVKDLDLIEKLHVTKVRAAVTHGIFSLDALDKINKCNVLKEIIVTNSLPQQDNMKACSKLKCLDLGPLLAEVTKRIFTRQSVSELFQTYDK